MDSTILTLAFQPRRHEQLGLEVATIAEVRLRGEALLARPQRLLFYSLIALTEGAAEPMVDFQRVPCRAGDVLCIAPQQVFQLFLPTDCAGYVVLFLPEALPPDAPFPPIDGEPRYRCADVAAQQALFADYAALLESYRSEARDTLATQIMRWQVQIILARLAQTRLSEPAPAVQHAAAALTQRFRNLVEQHYRQQRAVAAYAAQLFCSTKTLQRAVQIATGQTGKAVIDARVILEAQRLLAHTDKPVGAIGATLGFSEATNFVKYFQRHVGVSPERFRLRFR